MNTNDWSEKTISPKRDEPPKVDIRYPCPGLCRFAATVGFTVVGMAIYYGATSVLGLESVDWEASVWTGKRLGAVIAALLLGAIAGLFCFGFALSVEIRSERLNHFFNVVWQFWANSSLVWLAAIGTAMSVSLGQEEASAAVLRFGAGRAVLQVLAIGSIVGLLQGLAFFLTPIIRLRFATYLVFALVVSLFAARIQFLGYGIDGRSWIAAGLVTPILLLLMAPWMIERDRRQRQLVIEEIEEFRLRE